MFTASLKFANDKQKDESSARIALTFTCLSVIIFEMNLHAIFAFCGVLEAARIDVKNMTSDCSVILFDSTSFNSSSITSILVHALKSWSRSLDQSIHT
jgi:hypothetical protein